MFKEQLKNCLISIFAGLKLKSNNRNCGPTDLCKYILDYDKFKSVFRIRIASLYQSARWTENTSKYSGVTLHTHTFISYIYYNNT